MTQTAIAAVTILALALPLAAQDQPTAIRLVDPWTEAPVDAGPNPVELNEREVVLFRAEGVTTNLLVYLDGVFQYRLLRNSSDELNFGLAAPPDGVYVLEVQAEGDCPPATVKPTGCSRYFAFSIADGVVTQVPEPPTGLRIVR